MSYRVRIQRRRRVDVGKAWRKLRHARAARRQAQARRAESAAWQAGFDARTRDYLASRPEELR